MANPIHVRVLTEAGVVLEDEAFSVVAPGEPGYLGILRNHAPLVTTLANGKLTWRRADGTSRTAVVGPGLLEVFRNRLTLVTDRFSESHVR